MVSDAVHRIVARSGDDDTFMGKELPPARWLRDGPGGVFELTESERRPSVEVPGGGGGRSIHSRKLVSVAARKKKFFVLTADKIPIDEVIERVHPDVAERFWANREGALDPANPKPYVHHEFRVRRQDGTVRW